MANFFRELLLFAPYAYGLMLCAMIFQVCWVCRSESRREKRSAESVEDPYSLLRECDRLVAYWMTSELCGIALALSGVPLALCLVAVLAIGFLSSLPSYHRICRRLLRAMPMVGLTSRAVVAFVGCCLYNAGTALFQWVNEPPFRADRIVRRLIVTAVLSTSIAVVLRFAGIPNNELPFWVLVVVMLTGFFVAVFTTEDETPS